MAITVGFQPSLWWCSFCFSRPQSITYYRHRCPDVPISSQGIDFFGFGHGEISNMTISMDWFKGKSTGNHRFYMILPLNIWGFPVKKNP